MMAAAIAVWLAATVSPEAMLALGTVLMVASCWPRGYSSSESNHAGFRLPGNRFQCSSELPENRAIPAELYARQRVLCLKRNQHARVNLLTKDLS
jgi:hypothetical protein